MKRKGLITCLLIVCLCLGALAGCGAKGTSGEGTKQTGDAAQTETAAKADAETEESMPSDTKAETETVSVPSQIFNVGAMKGPTAMGMAQMLDDAAYHFSIVASPDEIVPMIVQGQVDIAAVPANLASVLYQKTDKQVSVLAINTLGVLYIVENGDTIKSAEDLKGKTIYASGKGATPEYALNSVLKAHGIDPEKDVTIEYKSEHTEVVAALAADSTAVGLLPQPFVTTALAKNESLRVALDLNALWEDGTEDGSRLVTGVVIARNEFIAGHAADVEAFLQAYETSVNFVNENTETAAEIIGAHDIVATEVAMKAIPKCSIVFIDGDEMKTMLSGYLKTLLEQNPQTIGGQVPDDAFYYER